MPPLRPLDPDSARELDRRMGRYRRALSRKGSPMHFVATSTLAQDVKPGEIFSNRGRDYWDYVMVNDPMAIGQKVYLRTHAPCPQHNYGQEVWVITTAE